MVDVDLGFRFFHFQLDNGNINNVTAVHNQITFANISIFEKLKYDSDPWSVYLFGGVKANIEIKRSIDRDFSNIFSGSKPVIFGLTSGIGLAKRFFRFWRVSFDIYYNHDLTKMYTSNLGNIQLNEFGFKLGVGPYNPATK